ncbi:hypothetical protein GQF61_16245 [Sphingobacterium sp. DK4209]|uniref:DUF6291 domain-containing protein n=1 Tax=Sphingobacterium zhuxiongii TaxID=2662364 RepID=A0A5Q0Q8G1_9SPHI|nr:MULTISPECIES: DUF6291 domain-containing protein [unclassified Sphingobacterium]MVZ67406.1 hypothetical protein [Sphingobacterium sp. DK4209]QGA25399.1 hypothetical protein GFH32_03260 [Sphingobacterium sp. dk4302]
MAEDKKSFLAYADWKTQFNLLSNEEAGILIKHILSYVNDENPTLPQDDRIIQIAFEPIKLQLKRDLKKYESAKQDKAVNGIIGNLKRWHLDLYEKYIKKEISLEEAVKIASTRKESPTDSSRSAPIANIADTVNDTVNVNDTVTVNDTDINNFLGADAEKKTVDNLCFRSSTPPKEEKEKSSAQKEKAFGKSDFKQALLDRDANEQHVDDWLKVRTAAKASFTQTSLNKLLNECDRNNYPVARAVQACAEYSWRGFEYQWILNKQKYAAGKQSNTTNQSRQERVEEVREFRSDNRQALADRLSQYITSNPE